MTSASQHRYAYTYAVGDLHGEAHLLATLLAALELTPADTLVFLGDYVDRGEDSVGTVLALRQLAATQHCVFLRGNHEAAWLEVWDGRTFTETPHIIGARAAWERCGGSVQPEVGEWLAQTRLDWEDGYAYYAHAGALPGQPFWRCPEEFKLLGHAGFLTSTYDWGKRVVFGHFELAVPLVQQNKVGIDTAAYRTGTLTAVRFPGCEIVQVHR
jgi:serine/threonine protein phosphatase 1